MCVFVTGASGWIGSAAVTELLAAGHEVTGLARSDAAATALAEQGVRVRRGDLDDLAGLRSGAAEAEAVLHLANKHDWSDVAASNAAERAAVETFGEVLAGSGRPLLIASGVAALAPDRPAAETDPSRAHGPASPRGGAENLALEFVERGVHSVALRFAPTVHGAGDHGFVSYLTAVARGKGVSGYVGEGANRWSAVHRSDAARLVALALAKAPAGARVHAAAEEGVSTRAIAEAIGRAHGLPVRSIDPDDAVAHFGFIGGFFGMEMSATSTATRELLGWHPTGPTLIEDIDAGAY
ncbi:NAD-dependent epimerase/dehydratase family protein [Pseudonocardia xishanensis]|uniref:SDR family oxidoreductase n=1 Tax=Pseudonocardia xishanensis TaxID=630995 RepID=A0ABP8RXB1_9PSEU